MAVVVIDEAHRELLLCEEKVLSEREELEEREHGSSPGRNAAPGGQEAVPARQELLNNGFAGRRSAGRCCCPMQRSSLCRSVDRGHGGIPHDKTCDHEWRPPATSPGRSLERGDRSGDAEPLATGR